VVDWRCSLCGGGPKIVHRFDHDGWHRFEHAVVQGGVAVRVELVTLCSIDCVLDWLGKQQLAVHSVLATDPDVVRRVDEIEEQS
jgi:hypothetical protein